MLGVNPSGLSSDHVVSEHPSVCLAPTIPQQERPQLGSNGSPIPALPPSAMPTDLPDDQEANPVALQEESTSAPPHYHRPRARTTGRNRWIPGDVIRLTARGVSREVKIRQRGADPQNLVLTWKKSREPVLSKSGSPISLPPFDSNILVTPGPFIPALDLDCFIRDQPLPPYVPFQEILSGMHDEYFQELFEKNPESRPPTPEAEMDEIDDLPDEAKVQALRLRIEGRRQFRESLGLPSDPQDLVDEEKLALLLKTMDQVAPVPQVVVSPPPTLEQPPSPGPSPGSSSGLSPCNIKQPDAPQAQEHELGEGVEPSAQLISIENPVATVITHSEPQDAQSNAGNTNLKRKRGPGRPPRTLRNEQPGDTTMQDGAGRRKCCLILAMEPHSLLALIAVDIPTTPATTTPRRSTRTRPENPKPVPKLPPPNKGTTKLKAPAKASNSKSKLKDPSQPEQKDTAEDGGVAGGTAQGPKRKPAATKSTARLQNQAEMATTPSHESSGTIQTRSKSKGTQANEEPDDGTQEPPSKKRRSKQ